MILAIPELASPIPLDENRASVLVVENPQVFCGIIQQLSAQYAGEEGSLVLSQSGKTLSFEKDVLLLRDPFALDVNDRKILTALINAVKKEAAETCYKETVELEQRLREYAELLLQAVTYPVDYTVDIYALLKNLGMRMSSDGSLFERVNDYLRAAQELLKIRLTVLVGFKAYLTENELKLLYRDAFQHKLRLLLIEPFQRPPLDCEYTVCLDTDRCEIRFG